MDEGEASGDDDGDGDYEDIEDGVDGDDEDIEDTDPLDGERIGKSQI